MVFNCFYKNENWAVRFALHCIHCSGGGVSSEYKANRVISLDPLLGCGSLEMWFPRDDSYERRLIVASCGFPGMTLARGDLFYAFHCMRTWSCIIMCIYACLLQLA